MYEQYQTAISKATIVIGSHDLSHIEELRNVLEPHARNIFVCDDWEEGRGIIDERRVDYVLMDGVLLEEYGKDIFADYRREPNKYNLPIAGLMDTMQFHKLNHFFNEGLYDCIHLPIDKMEVLKKVSSGIELYALRDYHNFTSILLDKLEDMILTLDEEGVINSVSQKFVGFLGLPAEQLIGKHISNCLQFYSSDDKIDIKQLLLDAQNEQESVTLPKHATMIDLQHKQYNIGGKIIPLFTHHEATGYYMAITSADMEIKLKKSIDHANKLQSWGALSSGIAHKMNSPLSNIIQGGQNILRRLDDTKPANIKVAESLGIKMEQIIEYTKKRKILEFIDAINQSGHEVADILEKLLQVADEAVVHKSVHKIAKLADTAIKLAQSEHEISHQIEFDQIKVTRDFEEDLPAIPCSSTEIEQVIYYLLKNAAHAVTGIEREPEITVSIHKEGGNIVTKVIDNGCGIAPEHIKRVFEPFYTTKPKSEGTGLGLSVADSIITTNHGGRIDIRSEQNVGTCVSFALPLTSNGAMDEL